MGPCRIDPFGEGPQKGVCGAGADLIVARNLGRAIAAGSSAHSDHGRDILEVFAATAKGDTSGYQITDEAKLRRLAEEWGVTTGDRPVAEIASDLADAMYTDFGSRKKELGFVERAPDQRRALWERLGLTPRGIDRENVEMLHRTHMGVDSDYANILLHGLRTSLADGWGGSMIATELSDVMFGTPTPRMSQVNLGTLKVDQVNIALHGHNPLLSDVIVQAAADPELVALAHEKGAAGINLVGLCCTGNELLMRRGVPIAGNHLMQELVIMTGALEAMVVDYQCIMPSVTDVAKCFHTKVISTSDKAKFPGATHVPFDPQHGLDIGKAIVRMAVEAYPDRNPDRVRIPTEPVPMMSGFSVSLRSSRIIEALMRCMRCAKRDPHSVSGAEETGAPAGPGSLLISPPRSSPSAVVSTTGIGGPPPKRPPSKPPAAMMRTDQCKSPRRGGAAGGPRGPR